MWPGVYTAPIAVKKVPMQSKRPITAYRRWWRAERIDRLIGSRPSLRETASPMPSGSSRGYTTKPPYTQ